MTGETSSERQSRHKKEVKSLEGEKRAALKKAKSLKGKKGKEALAAAEEEFAKKGADLKARHAAENEAAEAAASGVGDDAGVNDGDGTPAAAASAGAAGVKAEAEAAEEVDEEALQRQRKIEKARKKKAKAKQKELDRQAAVDAEVANAGPSMRQIELDRMKSLYLNTRKLDVEEVESDGHCLYRAVAVQCVRVGIDVDGLGNDGGNGNGEAVEGYKRIRSLCADALETHEGDYAPFAELDPTACSTYSDYVHKVRSTSEWGGQLELRALSVALKRPIVVYSADGPPLTMGEEYHPSDDYDHDSYCLHVSYHKHYYALGEHYNSVVPREGE